MGKIASIGMITSVTARIRYVRSFGQILTHQYQDYTLITEAKQLSEQCRSKKFKGC
jgi:hypothetical protein